MRKWIGERETESVALACVCASCETLVSSLNDQWETELLHYILFFFLTMICEIKWSTFDDKQAHQVSVAKYLSQFQLRWKLSIKKMSQTNERKMKNSLTWTGLLMKFVYLFLASLVIVFSSVFRSKTGSVLQAICCVAVFHGTFLSL